MTKTLGIAIAIALLAGSFAHAQATRPDPAQQQLAREYLQLNQELAELFKDKDYEKAADKCRQIIELLPKRPDGHYNLACAMARLNKAEEAFAALDQCVLLGYAEPAHMKTDADLESLRKDPRFDKLAARARENQLKAPYEKAQPIEGVKTVEDFPEGGLRFRLHMSKEATREKPNRLIIWLHPSGGSMNKTVEAMAPELAQHGYALMVLTQKQFMGWTPHEAVNLMDNTLPAVARIDGIDAAKPLLFGYSAGGQMALAMWREKPDAFGGLILDAAYPIGDMAGGKVTPMKLPEDEAIKKAPIFVIVGTADGGAMLWRQLTPAWLRAGVPLHVNYVKDQKHAWLFGKAQRQDLFKWLDDVTAGKLPADPMPTTAPATQPEKKSPLF